MQNADYKMMIWLYSRCTGNTDKKSIKEILGKSWIYEEVKNGTNEALANEGFVSNLLDIVDDLHIQMK